jgi:dienelactone hydrolase
MGRWTGQLGLISALAALLLLASGCAGSDKQAQPPATGLYAYDASAPLRFEDRGRVNRDYPIAIRDVSYAARGGRVIAFLALPPRAGRMPAVVYLHGSGGDRSQLLVPATWLAARRAVTLALTAPSSTAQAPQGLSGLAALRWQREIQVRDIIAARRAVDLLRSRPEVDAARIGFVGWSAGAKTGAILAGVDRRVSAFVLMSGGALPVSEYAERAPAGIRPDVTRILGQADPLRFVGAARPETLLFQNGRHDEVVPKRALEALAGAAPDGADVRWYEARHALDAAAYRDHLAWLSTKLGISGPPVPGAKTGP